MLTKKLCIQQHIKEFPQANRGVPTNDFTQEINVGYKVKELKSNSSIFNCPTEFNSNLKAWLKLN